jgi:hypothetical protein
MESKGWLGLAEPGDDPCHTSPSTKAARTASGFGGSELEPISRILKRPSYVRPVNLARGNQIALCFLT